MNKSVRALVAGMCLVSPAFAAAQPPKDPPAAVKPEAAAKADSVKLLEPGAEPRRELRYAPKKGDVHGFEMKMKMAMSGTGQPAMAMPTMVMSGDIKIVDVLPDGNFKTEFLFGEGKLEDTEGVMPMVVSSMQASMTKMAGIAGEFVYSPRGEVVSGSYKLPADADPAVKQTMEGLGKSMQQMSVPLPSESVGKGARWECTRSQETNGVKMNAVYTQQLTELTDKGFSSKVAVKGEAPKQMIQGVQLDGMKMSGDGTMSVDLSWAMPVDSKMSSKAEMTMDIPVAPDKMTMTMDMNMTMKRAAPTGVKPPAAKPEPAKSDAPAAAPKF